ncbi:MAG: cyclophilin-like fold protein [Corynebacterium sp.]|nr:cyclophilin-like fold protein [Corynebacterium sp.]
MQYITGILLSLAAALGFGACTPQHQSPTTESTQTQAATSADATSTAIAAPVSTPPAATPPESTTPASIPSPIQETSMAANPRITLNGQVFNFHPTENAAVEDLRSLGNISLTMSEFNGNEFYSRLPRSLPTNNSVPEQINAGDVMLWTGNTLVIFYETFTTRYSYTRLGHIDNPDAIRALANQGSLQAELTW